MAKLLVKSPVNGQVKTLSNVQTLQSEGGEGGVLEIRSQGWMYVTGAEQRLTDDEQVPELTLEQIREIGENFTTKTCILIDPDGINKYIINWIQEWDTEQGFYLVGYIDVESGKRITYSPEHIEDEVKVLARVRRLTPITCVVALYQEIDSVTQCDLQFSFQAERGDVDVFTLDDFFTYIRSDNWAELAVPCTGMFISEGVVYTAKNVFTNAFSGWISVGGIAVVNGAIQYGDISFSPDDEVQVEISMTRQPVIEGMHYLEENE